MGEMSISTDLSALVRKGSGKEGRPHGGQHRHHQHPQGAIATLQHAPQDRKEQQICQEVLEANMEKRCSGMKHLVGARKGLC